jgi:uridine phosphorylase
MALAQAVLEKPLMANHHHGLWGYSGTTAADQALTVQSTGIGGPSTAAVAAELVGLGVTRAVRLGACTALDGALATGDVVVVDVGLGLDGTSRALGLERPTADPTLTAALTATLRASTATAVGYDLASAAADRGLREDWIAAGATVADGETAALFALAEREGLAVAAALIVEPVEGELVELGERVAPVLAELA